MVVGVIVVLLSLGEELGWIGNVVVNFVEESLFSIGSRLGIVSSANWMGREQSVVR